MDDGGCRVQLVFRFVDALVPEGCNDLAPHTSLLSYSHISATSVETSFEGRGICDRF